MLDLLQQLSVSRQQGSREKVLRNVAPENLCDCSDIESLRLVGSEKGLIERLAGLKILNHSTCATQGLRVLLQLVAKC